MYVVDGACSCVSFIARGVAEQKYNPKTGVTPASQRCEHQPTISFPSPSLRGGLQVRRGNLSFNLSKYKCVNAAVTVKYAHKKSSAEAELNLKYKG